MPSDNARTAKVESVRSKVYQKYFAGNPLSTLSVRLLHEVDFVLDRSGVAGQSDEVKWS